VYIKYGWILSSKIKAFMGHLSMPTFKKRRNPVAQDILLDRVNKILEKVLVHGTASLTEEEKRIMQAYSEHIKRN
jgi:hypothetical protein